MNPQQILLFPRPRTIRRLDPTLRHDHHLEEHHDPSLPQQGFTITVDDDSAVLTYADPAGLRYGRQTIEQLRDGDPEGRLPTVDVEDHPDYPTRGFMLDISRDRVPTRQTLDRLVDVLERCRYNHLQLYVEHTFAYADHREVWQNASPLDGDDMVWLRDRCADAGIELAANQNCFGHFARWLSHDSYRDRAECPNGFEIAPGVTFPPTVLEPTVDNARFVLDLVDEQVASFGARIVNIGCDETFELGRGASAERVESQGRTAVYAEHLRHIVEPLVAEGLQVQFWGDVIAHDPEQLGLIPTDGTVALVWNYDAPDTPRPAINDSLAAILEGIGIDLGADAHFATRLEPFRTAGVDYWVVPGTSTWHTIIGRLDNARSNLEDAARAGRDSGASGYMVTDWGDDGHHQPLTVSYPAIAYGGGLAWGIDANAGADVTSFIDRHLLDDRGGVMGGVLDRIGRLAARTGVVTENSSPIFAGLFPHMFILRDGEPDPDLMREVIRTLDDALVDMTRADPHCAQGDVLVEELSVAIELARFGAVSLAAAAGIDAPPAAERAAQLDTLTDRYRAAWLTTSRPGGLDDSTAHLTMTRNALLGDTNDG